MLPKIPPSEPFGPAAPLTRRQFLVRCGIAGAAFVAGLGIDAGWARLVRGPGLARVDYPRMVVGAYRIHHSVVGYLAVAIGAFYFPWVLVPLGLGIIVGHARRDRVGFLERIERS